LKKTFLVLPSLLVLLTSIYIYAAPYPTPTDSRATPFNCNILSTATALAAVTGCEALATGHKRYITDIVWSSSIISTTTNFMTITVGTGTDCATSARNVYFGYIGTALNSVSVRLATPIATDANDGVCFVHPGAGTRHVLINGYTAP
jgi:hypothetical protein